VGLFVRHRNSCFYLPLRGSNDRAVKSAKLSQQSIAVLVQSSEASMGTLTADQKVREYNRGQKAARQGRSRYWSEPSAYPFESDEHYEGRAGAFDQGYDDQFQRNLAEINRKPLRGISYKSGPLKTVQTDAPSPVGIRSVRCLRDFRPGRWVLGFLR
jgi:hypothetical protein